MTREVRELPRSASGHDHDHKKCFCYVVTLQHYPRLASSGLFGKFEDVK